MVKRIILALLLVTGTFMAQAQETKQKPRTEVLTEAQYRFITNMTRLQANELQLNEPDFIKLWHINRGIMVSIWREQEELRKSLASEKPKTNETHGN